MLALSTRLCVRAAAAAVLAAFLATGLLPVDAQDKDGKIGTINLASTKGCEAVKGEWRYHDVTTGVGEKKNEIEPKAHGKFDDSKWDVLKPESLGQGRGAGAYCWCWYRIPVTIPDKVGDKDFAGGPVWFSTTVDDYGEIWVDGQIDRAFGKTGRGAVSGFNARNRVRLQKKGDDGKPRDAKPGDVFQIAVLGINSPLGNPPGNKIFMHQGINLDFYTADAPNGGANVPKTAPPPEGEEIAKIDLLTKEGVESVKGVWRRHLITFHAGPNKNGIEPKAHGNFKDEEWEKVEDPAELKKPFGPGKFSMAWYRIKVTLPEKVKMTQPDKTTKDVEVAGSQAWFRTTVDDYAEVWVNGNIDLMYGVSGRGAIAGFNTQNEVLLSKEVKADQSVQIAVLAINSPFGDPPGNFIFFRTPTEIRFFKKK